jgi:hypothetical protein
MNKMPVGCNRRHLSSDCRYPVTAVRLSPTLGAEADSWADSQTDTPNRSEAIRRLVELGLKEKGK